MLHECALQVLRDNPFTTLYIPLWRSKGKAVLKQKLAACTSFDPKLLPYNRELVEWLKQQRDRGRKLILCTASDTSIAMSVARHLDLFDEVLASDGAVNLAGKYKSAMLEERFGRSGFDYAGNSTADLPIWACARRGVVMNASNGLARKAGDVCEIEQAFPPKALNFSSWWRVLRVHQWLKNLLLFVPMLAAHELANAENWVSLILASIRGA